MSNQDWMNPKQLNDELGIAESTQARYRQKRVIPFSKVGGFIFYSRKKIYEWLENHNLEADGARI